MRDKLQKTNISLYCEARQFVNNLLLLIVGVLIFTLIGDSGPSTFDLILIITFNLFNLLFLLYSPNYQRNPSFTRSSIQFSI